MNRLTAWLPRLVARVPASVHAKLLAAFLAIVILLITVGAVGLGVLADVNRRAEDLVRLQRKIAAYRQLQHDTTSQLYNVSSALLVPDDRTLRGTLGSSISSATTSTGSSSWPGMRWSCWAASGRTTRGSSRS